MSFSKGKEVRGRPGHQTRHTPSPSDLEVYLAAVRCHHNRPGLVGGASIIIGLKSRGGEGLTDIRRRLVHHQHRGAPEKGPRHTHQLPLPDGEITSLRGDCKKKKEAKEAKGGGKAETHTDVREHSRSENGCRRLHADTAGEIFSGQPQDKTFLLTLSRRDS